MLLLQLHFCITRSWLFKSWIALSTGQTTIRWISITKTNCVIYWIVIYPVDSAIHLQNNWGQVCNRYSQTTNQTVISSLKFEDLCPRNMVQKRLSVLVSRLQQKGALKCHILFFEGEKQTHRNKIKQIININRLYKIVRLALHKFTAPEFKIFSMPSKNGFNQKKQAVKIP